MVLSFFFEACRSPAQQQTTVLHMKGLLKDIRIFTDEKRFLPKVHITFSNKILAKIKGF